MKTLRTVGNKVQTYRAMSRARNSVLLQVSTSAIKPGQKLPSKLNSNHLQTPMACHRSLIHTNSFFSTSAYHHRQSTSANAPRLRVPSNQPPISSSVTNFKNNDNMAHNKRNHMKRQFCSKEHEKSDAVATLKDPKARKSVDLFGISMNNIQKSRRWYKTVEVAPIEWADQTQFEILLDGRHMTTPQQNRLVLPTIGTAAAIAQEWDQQYTWIRPKTLPMMTIAATTIDILPTKRRDAIDTMMSFLKTDTICFRSHIPELAAWQEKKFTPVNQWLSRRYRVPPLTTMTKEQFLAPTAQPEQTIVTLQWKLFHSTDFELGCLHAMSCELKSIVLALALSENVITIEQAISLSRLEESWQIEREGFVEGTHDVEMANIRVGITAASIFHDLLEKTKDPLFENF